MSISESSNLIPLRWPKEWRDASVLDAIHRTSINALFMEGDSFPGPIAERARALGFHIFDAHHLPEGVKMVDGDWPGVRLSRESNDAVDAGPTGAPWIDSNTWRVQLQRALTPNTPVWIRSETPKRVILADEIPVAIADAAVAGGRWIITVPPDFHSWTQLGDTLSFFAAHPDWPAMETKAVLGVLSTFNGAQEAMASEVLNLTARMHQPYRILLPDQPIPDLRAIIYVDEKPTPALRTKLLDYARRGGLLVLNDTGYLGDDAAGLSSGAKAQSAPPAESKAATSGTALQSHPRYTIHKVGLGRLAIPKEAVQDPYEFSADAQLLMSHRWDPVTFWNAGAYRSRLTSAPQGRALLQLVNYTGRADKNQVTARVRGDYRRAVLLQPGRAAQPLPVQTVGHAAEVHVPDFASCGALEFS